MQGVTAVHMAAQNGHTDVVSLLLSRSAGLLRIPDKHGRTPLHLSAAHGHYDMSLLLIGQGADIDAYDKVTIRVSTWKSWKSPGNLQSPRNSLPAFDCLSLMFLYLKCSTFVH